MLGISFSEIIVILVVALIVLGPDKLPEVARYIGRLTAELKKTSDALRREFYRSWYQPPIMPPAVGQLPLSGGKQSTLDKPAAQDMESQLRAGGTPVKQETET